MRHRIKKIPNLSTLLCHDSDKQKLLHSDKSTCFGPVDAISQKSLPATSSVRKRKGLFSSLTLLVLGRRKVSNLQRPVLFSPEKRGFREKMKSYVGISQTHNAYFYKSFAYSGTTPLVLASLALLFLISCLVNPVGRVEKTYAETINYPAVEGKNDIASISFTLNGGDIDGSEVSTEITPDEVSYISNTLKVTTNNIGKFAIVIQSASDSGNLVNSENGATIAPIASATTPNNFANNTWGYALSDTNDADSALTYNPLPAFQEEPTVQYTKSEPDDGNYNLKLVFAAKIGSNKPAGHYKTTALVSVVAEAKALTMTMQDFATSGACSSLKESTATEDNQIQLIDSRDGKTYWVTKMGDGQCWMTQNLDLDLSTSTPLTPDNTNITGNWTPTENTQTSASPNFGTSNNIIKSWDPGYAYYANGTTKTNSNEALAKDTTGQVNAHYLQGNYYTWVAAMAGNTTGNTSNNDICPKGWQLPLSNNGTTAKTFQALTNALGATSGTSTGSSDSKLLTSPGYFVRGGDVNNASLSGAGSVGYYWSSVPDGTDYAYYLSFSGSNVTPSNFYHRYFGMSVRCVAK